jgi:hypothetical protein
MDNHHRMHSNTATFSTSPFRRRRITWCILITFAFVFFFGAPWEMPAYLKDIDHPLSRANIANLVRPGSTSPNPKVDEIYGLLYLVTRAGDRQLGHEVKVVSDKPIEMASYAGGDVNVNWEEEKKALNEKHPVVVFSKVRGLRCSLIYWCETNGVDVLPVSDWEEYNVNDSLSFFYRYSKKAKALIEKYDLKPPPKIIEVDLRG